MQECLNKKFILTRNYLKMLILYLISHSLIGHKPAPGMVELSQIDTESYAHPSLSSMLKLNHVSRMM